MTNITVPELGESVVEARVAKWLKKEGDTVAIGEPLVELETEKIDLEVSADRAGVLTSIKHGEGADVKVGEVLAVLEPGDGAAAAGGPPPRNRPQSRETRVSGGETGAAEPAKPTPPADACRARRARAASRRRASHANRAQRRARDRRPARFRPGDAGTPAG